VAGGQERFYLLDASSHRVVAVGTDGSREEVFGGEGSGPGELRLPLHLDVTHHGIAERVWVSDVLNRRFTVYSREGEFLSSIPWPGGLRLVNPFRVIGEDRVVYGGLWPLTVAELAQQPPVHYLAASRILEGGPGSRARVETDTLALVRASGYHSVVLTSREGDRRTWFGTPILEKELHWARLPDGELVTVTGSGLAFEVRGVSGEVRSRVKVSDQGPPVTGAWKQWYVDQVLEMRSLEGGAFTPTRETVDLLPFAERIQLVGGLAADPRGRIWLRVRGSQPGRERIEIFTAEGDYLGTPGPGPLPAAFLGDGRILVRVRDTVEGADVFYVMRLQGADRGGDRDP